MESSDMSFIYLRFVSVVPFTKIDFTETDKQSLLSGETIGIPFLRSSRAGFYFFSTAKRSKQEMPSLTQIPKNQNIFLKSENLLRSNSSDFLTKNVLIFFTGFG
jgi:hypothetical protein